MRKKPEWIEDAPKIASISYTVKEKPVSSLKIKYRFPIGRGISTNENSALVRPFRKILRDGKNPGKISYLFLQDGQDHYVLGGFSYTDKHIIFFPGLIDRRLINFGPDEYLSNGVVLHIDHFTLEQNLENFHVTLDEETKFPNQKTKTIDENTKLWFVFKIQSSNKLELCPQELRITLYEELNEINRRLPIIDEARKNAIFPITKIEDDQDNPFFWYLEFFVSTSKDRSNYPKIGVIIMPNPDTTLMDSRKKAPGRTHQILLDGFNGSLYVRLSKIKGKIKNHLIFESGNNVIPKKINENKV